MIGNTMKNRLWNNKFLAGACVVFISALAGCASHKPPPPAYIPAFANQMPTYSTNTIRLQAIKDAALGIGAQGGLAWRSEQIDSMLQKQAADLDRIYDFNQLILPNNTLPPVLAEADNTLNLANTDTMRLADKTYKIVQPARLVTTPPNWRDYIWLNFKKPDAPDSVLLPSTAEERDVWNFYMQQGWLQGVDQANQIFSANLGRLQRDFQGIVLYRKLLAQKMVSSPMVAQANLGVTGGGNEMSINDRVVRITSNSALNAKTKQWRAVVIPEPPDFKVPSEMPTPLLMQPPTAAATTPRNYK